MKESDETKLQRAFPKCRMFRAVWGDDGELSPYAQLQIPDGTGWFGRPKWKTIATCNLSSSEWWVTDRQIGEIIEAALGVEVTI